jgi:hypothetical protein
MVAVFVSYHLTWYQTLLCLEFEKSRVQISVWRPVTLTEVFVSPSIWMYCTVN